MDLLKGQGLLIMLKNDALNKIKEKMLYGVLDAVGRVMVVVRFSEDVLIGNRGFTKDEKEKGLLLVLNKLQNWVWKDGIEGNFTFGELGVMKCFIPADSIVSIISQELGIQLITFIQEEKEEELPKNVIVVDFKNRKVIKRGE